MVTRKRDRLSDKSLGLAPGICRRDFLNGTLLAAGGALLGPFSLPSSSPRRVSGAATRARATIEIRTGTLKKSCAPATPSETVLLTRSRPIQSIRASDSTASWSGGISGLAAALYFQDQAIGSGRTCLVIENHPIFGGEAKRNEFIIDGQQLMGPQGSNLWVAPLEGGMIAQFYE